MLIVAELLLKNSDIRFDTVPFLQQFFIPFSREVHANFFDLFVSQVSTTFLVTSFLSFLSGNDSPIYWTTAMEYKLLNPKGTCIRDIAWYCIGTLVISLVAIFFQATFAFLFSFIANIIGLTIITCRMIVTFFAKDKIKDELFCEFERARPQEKERYLTMMEEKAIVAARNHDAGYLRDHLEFLKKTDRFIAPRALLRFCRIIPRDFYNLFADTVLAYCEKNNVPANSGFYRAETLQALLRYEVIAKTESLNLEPTNIIVQQQHDHMRTCILQFLCDDIADNGLLHENRERLLILFEIFTMAQFKEPFLAIMDRKEPIVGERFDFSKYFRDSVFLLKSAYNQQRNLIPYVASICSIHNAIVGNLQLIKDWSYDPNAIAHVTLPPTECDHIPPTVADTLMFYSWQNALTVFRCVLAEDAFHDDAALGEFLADVYRYTEPLTDSQRQQLRDIVTTTNILKDEDKQHLSEAMADETP